MRLDKFTLRAQEAIQAAIELAERNQNQQVEPEHLLAAMLEQPEGIVRPDPRQARGQHSGRSQRCSGGYRALSARRGRTAIFQSAAEPDIHRRAKAG